MNTNASHASQLRVISLFEDLQPAELLRVAGLCTMQACEKHTQIMGEQDQTTDVFFILAGSVRISSYTEAGREVIFTEMHAGDIFGEFSAVDRLPRSASIVALSDCSDGAHAIGQVLRGPERQCRYRGATDRAPGVQDQEDVGAGLRSECPRCSRARAPRTPAPGNRRHGFRNGVVVQPAPTHYEIAARIGSHREAVTREFNRLKSENIIEVRRKQIRIIDLERLKHADGD